MSLATSAKSCSPDTYGKKAEKYSTHLLRTVVHSQGNLMDMLLICRVTEQNSLQMLRSFPTFSLNTTTYIVHGQMSLFYSLPACCTSKLPFRLAVHSEKWDNPADTTEN